VAGICLCRRRWPWRDVAGGGALDDARETGASWLGLFYAGNIAGAVCGSLVAGLCCCGVYDITIATLVASGA